MNETAVYKNIIPIQVRFSDVDMMGHVSNTVYQTYYDSGKLNYFDQVTPDIDFINIGIVGASIHIEFLKPIFIKSRILVETRVSKIGNKSLTMEHRLVDELTNETLSTCKAVLVCFSVKEQKSIPVPQHWKENILAYDENVIVIQ